MAVKHRTWLDEHHIVHITWEWSPFMFCERGQARPSMGRMSQSPTNTAPTCLWCIAMEDCQ